jgi:ABC-type sugar transport system permease subunit
MINGGKMENSVNKNNIKINIKDLAKKIYRARLAYLFILPLFIFLLTFSYYPAISGIYHSLFDWSETKSVFIGFENYIELFTDTSVFLPSIITMLKIMIPKVLINIIVPLIFAEIIFNLNSDKVKGAYRLLLLLPIVAPGVVATLVWQYIYDPNYGLFTGIVKLFGGSAVDWLNNSKTVIWSIIFMGFPWVGGTSVLIYLSGLLGISSSIRESAKLDGASTLKIIMVMDLPLIIGQIKYFLIFGIIGGMQDYSVQILITNGEPGYDTMVPGYYMYLKAFTDGRMGYACAIGTLLFVFIMILTLISFRIGKKGEEEL